MIYQGDCLEVMPTFPPDSVDVIITDPPYGIGFMGHDWDQPGEFGALSADHGGSNVSFGGLPHPAMEVGRYDQSTRAHWRYMLWCEAWGAQLYRVAKPGAYLLSFGGTRTSHALTMGIELAGWEIRDTLVWAYASGFPKSLDVGRSIDQELCVLPGRHYWSEARDDTERAKRDAAGPWNVCPFTSEGDQHRGDGTALKPAWEPIVMARKPLRGTVAENVLQYGTGALDIDGTRIPGADGDGHWSGDDGSDATSRPGYDGGFTKGGKRLNAYGDGLNTPVPSDPNPAGRWPANLILTDPIFDGDTPGVVGGGEANRWYNGKRDVDAAGWADGMTHLPGERPGYDDSGTYSRFFLVPKSSRSDREPILRSLPERKPPGWSSGPQPPGTFQSRPTPPRQNVHPTVKPIELMRHLVRLVTPPGGTVLDPFLGSGTTALAAEMEGFGWIGIEREAEYVAIAEARLNGTQRGMGLG